jgi:hypothetical protein
MVLHENDNVSGIQIFFVHTNIMLWLRFGINVGPSNNGVYVTTEFTKGSDLDILANSTLMAF